MLDDYNTQAHRADLPFITDINLKELVLRSTGGSAAAMDYRDADGRTVARSVVTIDALEAFAFDCLALVSSSRANFGRSPDNVIPLRCSSHMLRVVGA